MAKLTKGVLAREQNNDGRKRLPSRECYFWFYPGVSAGDVGFDCMGYPMEESDDPASAWSPDDFRKKYTLTHHVGNKDTGERWPMPRPGQIVECLLEL